MSRIDDLDYEGWMLSEDEEFMALIERARQRYQQEGGLTLTEVRQKLGLSTDE